MAPEVQKDGPLQGIRGALQKPRGRLHAVIYGLLDSIHGAPPVRSLKSTIADRWLARTRARVKEVASCAYSSRLRTFSGTSDLRADRTRATRARGNTGGGDDRNSLLAARPRSLMLQAGSNPTGSCLRQWLFCLSLRLLLPIDYTRLMRLPSSGAHA